MRAWQRSRQFAAAKKEYKKRPRSLTGVELQRHEACAAADAAIAAIHEQITTARASMLAGYLGGIPGRFLASISVTQDEVILPDARHPLEPGLQLILPQGGSVHEYSLNRSVGNVALRRAAARTLLPGSEFFVNDEKTVRSDDRDLAIEFDSDTWNHVQPVEAKDPMRAFTFISQVKGVLKTLPSIRDARDRAVADLEGQLAVAEGTRVRLGDDPCPAPVRT